MTTIQRTESKDLDTKEPIDVSALEADTRGIPEDIAALSEEDYNATVKRIVRKADCVIMSVILARYPRTCADPRPIMGILYVLNYIDRQNLAAAKLQGIMEDLDMTTQQFATAISILFVGYLPFQLPSNLIISRLTRPGLCKFPGMHAVIYTNNTDICCACMIWGSISACTAAVQTYEALLGVRVLLGVSEAVFFPGAIYLLSAWYSKHELGVRIAGKSREMTETH